MSLLKIKDLIELVEDQSESGIALDLFGVIVRRGEFDAFCERLRALGMTPVETKIERYALLGAVGVFELQHVPPGMAVAVDKDGRTLRVYEFAKGSNVVNITEGKK